MGDIENGGKKKVIKNWLKIDAAAKSLLG